MAALKIIPAMITLVFMGAFVIQTHAFCFDWMDEADCADETVTMQPLQDAPIIVVSGTPSDYGGFFDGEYHAMSNMADGSYIWENTPSPGAWTRYIYKSDWYVGYYIISTDIWSTDIYGYASAPDAKDPSEVAAGDWQGAMIVGAEFKKMQQGPASEPTASPTAGLTMSPTMGKTMSPTATPATMSPTTMTPTTTPPTDPGTPPTTTPPTGSPATTSPTTSSPTASPPTASPATSPTAGGMSALLARYKNLNEPTSFACASGFTTDQNQVSGCSGYCGCSGGTCKYCCKQTDYCYRDGVAAASPTFNHGYKKASCALCEASMSNNGVCDPECNHVDCGFDGGECCSEAVPSTAEHPRNCVDPTVADMTKSFRMDFFAPRCRKAVRNQGSCGSCYAFAVSSAALYQSCFATLKAGPENFEWEWQYLGPQHIDSCNVYGSVASGAGKCQGGYTGYTYAAFTDAEGFRPEQCYPYQYSGSPEAHFGASVTALTCQNTYDSGVNTSKDQYKLQNIACSGTNNYKIHLSLRGSAGVPVHSSVQYVDLTPANAAAIKTRLHNEGPLPFSYTVYAGFYNLKAGVNGPAGAGLYTTTTDNGAASGGHAVMLLGYGEYTVGSTTTQYWVLENSWGESSSHDQGIFYLDMATDWAAKVGGYVVYFSGDMSSTDTLTVTKTNVTGASPATSKRRHLMSPGEVTANRRTIRRRRAQATDAPFGTANDVSPGEFKGLGAYEPTNCITAEVNAALTTGLKFIEDNFGIQVDINGLHGCETQVSETTNMMLEISVTLADGQLRYYEVNLEQSLNDYCGRGTVDVDATTLGSCEIDPDDMDAAQKLLDSFNVTGVNLEEYFPPARASKPSPAPVETNDVFLFRSTAVSVLMMGVVSLMLVLV